MFFKVFMIFTGLESTSGHSPDSHLTDGHSTDGHLTDGHSVFLCDIRISENFSFLTSHKNFREFKFSYVT